MLERVPQNFTSYSTQSRVFFKLYICFLSVVKSSSASSFGIPQDTEDIDGASWGIGQWR